MLPSDRDTELLHETLQEEKFNIPLRPEIGVARPPSRYYDNVAVLLIKWADELDELKTKAEVEELCNVFQDLYHFQAKVVELNVRKKPQHQLNSHISEFLIDNDAPNNLLIVFYSGHGVFHEDKRFLELTASTNSYSSRGFARDAHANWNIEDERLRDEDVEADVLVILDTNYASNICRTVTYSHDPGEAFSGRSETVKESTNNIGRSQQGISPKTVEMLAACPIDSTTAAPGIFSFTRALIDTLKRLLEEDPNSSFTTWELNQRISRDLRRTDTPSQLWSRLPNREGRHIRLGRLQKSTVDESAQDLAALPALPSGLSDDLPDESQRGVKRKLDTTSPKDKQERSSDNISFGYAASDSAYDSGFSDTASMWSVAFSESSHSSGGGLQYITQSATKKMAEVFWQNSDLHSLYLDASARLSKETFAKTHDDLLKTFFKDLRSETENDKQLKTVRILRHRAHREQVTEWIYNLAGPKMDTETLQARQNFLNQRESRDELLEQYLQSQAQSDKVSKQSERVHAPEGEGDSSDEEEEDAISLEELSSIVNFLTSGSSFAMLRLKLYSLAHPETAIAEALHTKNIEGLQVLLTSQFGRVAVGDYAWIKELDAAGYSRAEIAQLLAEESTDAPWIYFTPQNAEKTALSIPDVNFHVKGCVHGGKISQQDRVDHGAVTDNGTLSLTIHELCGIAGVAPSSRDKHSWNGSIQFAEGNTIAGVTYSIRDTASQDNNEALLARSIHTLETLVHAITYSQKSSVCCNSYTVIIHDDIPAFSAITQPSGSGTVRLHQIRLKCLVTLLREAQSLQANRNTRELGRSAVRSLQEAALEILEILGRHHFPSLEHLTYHETLHLVALGAQFASLAFLSYSQAHVAPIQPFYLDTALSKILLLGVGDPQKPSFHIAASTTSLTCMGNMLRSDVLVFSIEPVRTFGGQSTFGPLASCSYDIIGSAEDFIDTWDGGSLIVPITQSERGYFAIQLCGGIISPVLDSEQKEAVPGSELLFHWQSGNTLQKYHRTFETSQPIRVGAFVTVNHTCTIDENQCWRSSAPAFEILGVHDSVWRHDETQWGGQAGQYALLQYNRTMHKIPGTTLKTRVLSDIRSEAYTARHILNDMWGLQVSFCTGVARRVPLRVLMADLMPVVAETMTDCKEMWQQLNLENSAFNAFQSDSVIEWIETLDHAQRQLIDQLMRDILLTLEPTGVDAEGNNLTVAWVYQRPPYQCFRISCNDKRNSWMRVLTDSGDCATFAYVVTRCLETSTLKCRGPSPHWHSIAPLLETAVLRQNSQPSQPLGPLEHKKMYFFKKMDSLLQVTVEKQSVNGPVSLYIAPSSIPARFRQRLYNLERMRNQASRIRERREPGEMGAEAVTILTKADTRF